MPVKPLRPIAAVVSAAVLLVAASPGVAHAAPGEEAAKTLTIKGYARWQMRSIYHYNRWRPNQFRCVNLVFSRESGWRWNAENASGAYGIPQALPGSKMASAGANWRTSARTQVRWGLRYMKNRYGEWPCTAWQHELRDGWY